jgi:hypothetical protein
MNKNIIVFGASGATGQEICTLLSKKEIDHAAFVRPGSEHKIATDTTNIIKGNVMSEEEIKKGISGHSFTDAVIALGDKQVTKATIRTQGTASIIKAFSNMEITFHVISAHGIGDSWSELNWMEKFIAKVLIGSVMKDHTRQEDLIIQSGMEYHIIRPSGLKTGPATGNIVSVERGKLPSSRILRSDLATYLVDSVLDGTRGIHSVSENN